VSYKHFATISQKLPLQFAICSWINVLSLRNISTYTKCMHTAILVLKSVE